MERAADSKPEMDGAELDLTVAFTAGNYGQYGIWRKFRDELVTQFVLPAVVNP